MMTAQEYRDRKDELEKQITNLIEERERMVLERMYPPTARCIPFVWTRRDGR